MTNFTPEGRALSEQALAMPDVDLYRHLGISEWNQLAAAVPTHSAFRRGAHAAVQSIVDDFAGLVQRRIQAQSPELTTQTIVAMAKRIAERPYPTEDPGPADPATPDVPAPARPTPETLIAVACLAAEESGLPIQITVSSDGLQVYGTASGRPSVRAVTWVDLVTSPDPVLSHAVQAVIDELRS